VSTVPQQTQSTGVDNLKIHYL